MHSDWSAGAKSVLRVDGGMVASDWTMQFLADILDAPVERPVVQETTALGAAWLAGHKAGVWPDAEGFAKLWKLERALQADAGRGRARAQVRRLAARGARRAGPRRGRVSANARVRAGPRHLQTQNSPFNRDGSHYCLARHVPLSVIEYDV